MYVYVCVCVCVLVLVLVLLVREVVGARKANEGKLLCSARGERCAVLCFSAVLLYGYCVEEQMSL